MSLRGFHILFIVLAFLCTAGFWVWTVVEPEQAREAGAVIFGNLSGSLACALLVYGIWFVVRKRRMLPLL